MTDRQPVKSVQFTTSLALARNNSTQHTLTLSSPGLTMDSEGVYYESGDKVMMFPWHRVEYVEL